MRVLVIGDFHVPDRNNEIPLELVNSVNQEVNERPFDFLACTGDLTSIGSIEPVLNLWCEEKLIVQGNMDYFHSRNDDFFHEATFNTKKFVDSREILEIGIMHGHQVRPRGDTNLLAKKATAMGVHALISGHTHALSVELVKGTKNPRGLLLLNPGSATGSWSFVASGRPSYLVLEIKPFNEGLDVKIECHEFEDKKENKRILHHEIKNGSFI